MIVARGWIVVGTSFITLGLVIGIWYSYSVFLVALVRELGWSRSVVAGGFSVFVLVHAAVSPVVGLLTERVGTKRLILAGGCILGCGLLLTAEVKVWWHLYLVFGGVSAVGFTMSGWIPAVVLVRAWFPSRFGTAIGIASAGMGAGIFALVPFVQFLIDHIGWRWAFRVLAMLIVGWVLPATGAFIRERPPLRESYSVSRPPHLCAWSDTATFWTLDAAVSDWHFWALAGVFFTGNFVTQMLLLHQVAYLIDHGASTLAAASVGGVAGLASLGGKIAWGALSDRVSREIAYSLSFACVVGSIGMLVLAGKYPASSLPYLYALLLGVGYGGIAPVTSAATSDLFSGPGFGTIYGTVYTSLGLGVASGAWVAGWIFDQTRSYTIALWIALVIAFVSPALLWIAAPRRRNPPPDRKPLPDSPRG